MADAPDSPLPAATRCVVRGDIVTPKGVLRGGHIDVGSDGKIAAVHPAETPLPEGVPVVEAAVVVPGFVDIHNHGLGGCEEVCDHWQHPRYSQRHLARCGTLSCLASLIFSAKRPHAVAECVKAVGPRVGRAYPGCAVIEGFHAEGPVIADPGGLPPSPVSLSLPAFQELCDSMGPALKVMTIAPSVEATVGYARLRELLRRGVRPSFGHDKHCGEAALLGALRVCGEHAGGVQAHTTHLYNVMAFHHRSPGLVNFCLCHEYPRHEKYRKCTPPTVEVIGDLIHSHPVSLQMALSARATKDVAMISDCIASYRPMRRHKYNGRTITVKAEGGAFLCDAHGRPSQTLAGSTVALADQFVTLMTHFGVSVVEACRMLATNPARIAHVGHKVGAIVAGLDANLLLLDAKHTTILRRMVHGHWLDDDELVAEPYVMLRPAVAHL